MKADIRHALLGLLAMVLVLAMPIALATAG